MYVRPPDHVLPFNMRMSRDPTADHTQFVCGFLGCDDRPFNPLLDSLPHIVHSPVSHESRQWVSSLLEAATQTGDGGVGREAMLAKLAELMFVERCAATWPHFPRTSVAGSLVCATHPSAPPSGSCTGARPTLDAGVPGPPGRHVQVLVRRTVHRLRGHPRCSTSPGGASSSPRG
ncbi:cupin domain-containing protein [Oerskovia sp. M15]